MYLFYIFDQNLNIEKKSNIAGISYIFGIAACIVIINFFILPTPITESNFLNWDAYHYHLILTSGFNDSNVAFFSFFPSIWSYTGLSALGISLFNFVFFIGSFFFLNRLLKNPPLDTLLFLSLPSLVFMALPYTEALFFLACTIMVWGLRKQEFHLVLIGLFIASLCRPVVTIFIPAFIISEVLSDRNIKKKLIRIIPFILIGFTGLMLATYIQYEDTRIWFASFKVQENWNTYLRVPEFPLSSYGAGIPTRLDGLALLTGTISGIIVLLKIFRNKTIEKLKLTQDEIFSLSYLAGISLMVLLYRGGVLASLNRYVFGTVFFMVAFKIFLKHKFVISWKYVIYGFLLITIFWLFFGSYVHIQTLLKYALVSLIPIGLLLFKNKNKLIRIFAMSAIILVNIVFQLFFYFRHLTGEWVG